MTEYKRYVHFKLYVKYPGLISPWCYMVSGEIQYEGRDAVFVELDQGSLRTIRWALKNAWVERNNIWHRSATRMEL